jgi:L-asparagine transporter-like permease
MTKITKKAWFGKRILGWGYRPISLEGWLVTVVFLVAILVSICYLEKTTTRYAILAVILIVFHIIIYLTGNAPGSELWDKLRNK